MNPALMMPEEGMTVDELSNFVAEQLKRLNLVLRNIDGLNIVDIKFELQGGAYIQLNRKGLRFNDGTKDTLLTDIHGNVTLEGVINALGGTIGGFTIDLTKLSGDGIIEGGTVRTKGETEYPRAEMNSVDNLFQALASETKYIQIVPSDVGGTPGIFLVDGTNRALISQSGKDFTLGTLGTNGDSTISASRNINLSPDFGNINVPSWNKLYSDGNNQTLQQALNGIQSQISGLQSQINSLSARVTALGG